MEHIVLIDCHIKRGYHIIIDAILMANRATKYNADSVP